jgi:hypothetical protein
VKFVLCVLAAGCGGEQAAEIDQAPGSATVAAEPVAAAQKREMPPLILRCEGEINGRSVKYEARRLPSGTLIYGAVGSDEASQVTQQAPLFAHRIGLLVESHPPTFLRAEPGENGMRLRAAQLAEAWHFPCWAP